MIQRPPSEFRLHAPVDRVRLELEGILTRSFAKANIARTIGCSTFGFDFLGNLIRIKFIILNLKSPRSRRICFGGVLISSARCVQFSRANGITTY